MDARPARALAAALRKRDTPAKTSTQPVRILLVMTQRFHMHIDVSCGPSLTPSIVNAPFSSVVAVGAASVGDADGPTLPRRSWIVPHGRVLAQQWCLAGPALA